MDPARRGTYDAHAADELTTDAGRAAAATMVSRIAGLAREQVLAAVFGAGHEMDAFVVAFRIPNLLRDLFAEGAMSSAFVPTFTRALTLEGKPVAWALARNVLTALALTTGLITAAGMIWAEPLVSHYATTFATTPGKLALTITLARVMAPFLVLAALAAAVMGMLNALRHYFIPALSPATFNVATIACALGLTPLMPMLGLPRIMAVAIGTVTGGILQVAVQWPLLQREGFRFTPRFAPRDPGLREILLLMGPGTLGLAATQVNLFVSTLLATSQGPGAVSWLQYAFRIMYLPLGLFGASVATAVLPAAARHIAVQDRSAVRRTVSHGLRLMLAVSLPAMCGLLLLAPDIVRLLLQRGHFTASDTAATAFALRCYAAGLVGFAASRITSPVFYALRRTHIPVLLSTASIVVNLGASLVFVRALGYGGLALATSVAACVHAMLSVWWLRAEVGGLQGYDLLHIFGKTVGATAVMGSVVWGTRAGLGLVVSTSHAAGQGVVLLASIAAGVAALMGCASVLRIEELGAVLGAARRTLIRR